MPEVRAPEPNPSTLGGLRSLGSEATRQQAAAPDLSNPRAAQPVSVHMEQALHKIACTRLFESQLLSQESHPGMNVGVLASTVQSIKKPFKKVSIRGSKLRLQEGGKTAESEQPLAKMPPPPVPTRPAASTSKPRSKNKRTPKEFVFMESQEPQNHSFRKASVVSVNSALMTRSAK